MTYHEALMKLRAIKARQESPSDVKADHAEADEILCDLLTQLGAPDVVEAFKSLAKWYA